MAPVVRMVGAQVGAVPITVLVDVAGPVVSFVV